MKEKIASSCDLIVRQELWDDSPCSNCPQTPCCRNLPLVSIVPDKQSDFITLILASAYDGIYPAMKKSGEWVIFLGRKCRFLNSSDGKCLIHKQAHQSMICKSYNAHECWYVKAYTSEENRKMIPFSTEMLVHLEQKCSLLSRRFKVQFDWTELCDSFREYGYKNPGTDVLSFHDNYDIPKRLTFRKSGSEDYLFFPPYTRPEYENHFELISFRLGFPGVFLAVSSTCWAYAVKTGMNSVLLNTVREAYYPAIQHKDFAFGFHNLKREQNPYSDTGEQWVILRREDIGILKSLVVFDSFGRAKKFPSTAELLGALNSTRPDRVA